jgi:hypothetical protein
MIKYTTLAIIFYILFLIFLLIGQWFLLYYLNVPGWVWGLFFVAALFLIIALILKLNLRTGCNNIILLIYIIVNVLAIILIMAGFTIVISYAAVPAWIFLLLGISAIFWIIISMLTVMQPLNIGTQLILIAINFIISLVAIIYLIMNATVPTWIYVFIILAIIFNIVSEIIINHKDTFFFVCKKAESEDTIILTTLKNTDDFDC